MMTSTQYLRWGKQSPEQFSWFRVEKGLITHRGESTLATIAEAQGHSRVVLLVPTKDTLLTELVLPTRNQQKLLKAVPYALEEQLTEDVEDLHFAIDRADSTGRCGVVVVKRSMMLAWLKPFDEAGIQLSQILPDIVTLPVGAGEASLVIYEDEALLRLSQREGYALPNEDLASLINGALSEKEGTPQHLKIYQCSENALFDPTSLQVNYEIDSCDGGIEQRSARQLSKLQSLDLLQGEFSRKEQLWRHFKPWRAAAVLLLSVLLLQGAGSIIEVQRLQDIESALQMDMEKLYRETFPSALKVVNPRLQMEQKLKERSGRGGEENFSKLMVVSAPVISAMAGSKIEVLRYKQDGLELDIELKDLLSLDRLKEQLTAKGLVISIQNASSTGDRVTGRISIKGGAL